MEDKTLVCKINMFDEFQYLEFRDSSSIGVPFEELHSVLPAFCHEHGNESYISGLIQAVRANDNTFYAEEKKLEFEVN